MYIKIFDLFAYKIEFWWEGYNSVVESMLRMHEFLGSIPSTFIKKKLETEKKINILFSFVFNDSQYCHIKSWYKCFCLYWGYVLRHFSTARCIRVLAYHRDIVIPLLEFISKNKRYAKIYA